MHQSPISKCPNAFCRAGQVWESYLWRHRFCCSRICKAAASIYVVPRVDPKRTQLRKRSTCLVAPEKETPNEYRNMNDNAISRGEAEDLHEGFLPATGSIETGNVPTTTLPYTRTAGHHTCMACKLRKRSNADDTCFPTGSAGVGGK